MAGEILSENLDRTEKFESPMGTIYVAVGEKAQEKLKSSKQLLGTWDLTKCKKVKDENLRTYIFADIGVEPIIYDFVTQSYKDYFNKELIKRGAKMKAACKLFKGLTKKLYRDYDNQGGSIFKYCGPKIDISKYRD